MFDHERSLVKKYQNRPFVLLGVDLDQERETLQEAEKEHKLNWRSWWDNGGSIAQQWNVQGIPALFLLDGKGVIRWQTVGVPNSKKLEDLIEKLVKETEGENGKQASLSRDR